MITLHLHVSTDSLYPLHDHYPVYPSRWTTQDERKEQAAMKEFQSCVMLTEVLLREKRSNYCKRTVQLRVKILKILDLQADKKLDSLTCLVTNLTSQKETTKF